MGEHDATRVHSRIKVIQAGEGALIQIHIEMGEGEFFALGHLGGRVREETFVVEDIGKGLKVRLDGFDATGVKIGLGAVRIGIVFASGGQARESIEEVEADISLALANHAGGAAFEDADFSDRSRQLALGARKRVEEESFVAGEQPFALAAGLPDQAECIGVLVKAKGDIFDA